ncbi:MULTISPECIES: hypothetical protein [Sorangium]|uniref:Tetratricopeptide repeat protein n=1 Tax=Sorangium cellulosum TaxID=56 RepID=A0A4P2QFY0_SORCE|nr:MULTISPECIES: hypothetical protein [Sorangium]AUX28709.1 hypothetical protein SOCE836_007900 [Sorangium cellulosum]WCQ88106.1 hypothetical protein NQZ70_00778 [Sorangium sp. Soce836]
MPKERVFSLDAVRTDGWFERIGDGIGSFQALCEIVGEAFFAFSMITGARITALTVDRRNPDNTLVDFVIAPPGEEEIDGDVQRLTLADFRHRLVGALLTEDTTPQAPERDTDLEGIQLHIGVRYLLLAPLYGYSLRKLSVEGKTSRLLLLRDGIEETHELNEFRARIRSHVRDELERASAGARSAIDLTKVAEAEVASQRGDYPKVIQLLGTWPAPLAIFLRTPEGQMLTPDARSLIAKGLGLLGTACVKLGEEHQGEEVMRLAVQYAHDGAAAGDIFRRLGEAMLDDGRAGEAIGPLRRAANLGAPPKHIWPLLARAFVQRKKYVAALACVREARSAGVPDAEMVEEIREIEASLGTALTAWRGLVLVANRS